MSFQENPTWAVVCCLLLTAAIEMVTCLLRFSLNLEATRDTAPVGQFTFGLRIHHAYIGVAMIALGLLLSPGSILAWSPILGIALVLSDLIHHFVVLWPVTGDPQFHLSYPGDESETTVASMPPLAANQAILEVCDEI